MSTFSGINTALSSLLAFQRAIEVTGQNLANVATPGYHRQEVGLAERAVHGVGGQPALLAGVTVLGLRRADTAYLDLQSQRAASEYGRWSATQGQLTAVQSVLSPAPGQDLSGLLDAFWNSWQKLSAAPDQLAPRLAVQSAGERLASGIRNQQAQLTSQQAVLYRQVQETVAQLNEAAAQLADLSARLDATRAGGGEIGDLLDQRERLLGRLAELSGAVSYAPDAAGGPIVTLGGHPLVQGPQAFRLEASLEATGEVRLTWSELGTEVTLEGGSLSGLIWARDVEISGYLDTLDAIAVAVIEAVNTPHLLGVGLNGETGPFFTGAGAADIRLADGVAADAAAIAAGSSGLPGDMSVAASIAALRDVPIVGGTTANEAAAGLPGRVGGAVKQAQEAVATAQAVQQQMLAQQQSVSGVSLEEEMTRMLQYQDAFSAASQVLVTMNQMLGDVLGLLE